MIRHYKDRHKKIYFSKRQQKCASCKNYFKSEAQKTSHKCGCYVGKEPPSSPSAGEDYAEEEQDTATDHFDEDQVAGEDTAGEEQDGAVDHLDDDQVANQEEAEE